MTPLSTGALDRKLSNIYYSCGRFYFQKRKSFTIRIPHIRWSKV